MRDRGEKFSEFCPLNGKLCINGVREDFDEAKVKEGKKCRWWEHLYGNDPQTQKPVDQWDCSVAWLPIMMAENAQMSRQTSASVDKVANIQNETKKAVDKVAMALTQLTQGFLQVAESQQKLLQGKAKEDFIGENGKEGEND